MTSSWLGLIEMFVVFGFLIGYGVVELYILRRDKRRVGETPPDVDDDRR